MDLLSYEEICESKADRLVLRQHRKIQSRYKPQSPG
jgi:hypothetical protein